MNIFKSTLFLVVLLLSISTMGQKASTADSKSSLWKRTSFTPIPIVSYSRSNGITLGGMLTAFTDINPNDTISPASRTTVGFGFTQNKSWFGVVSQRLFFNKDKLRVLWNAGMGKNNFQFWDESDESGNGAFIAYNTNTQFIGATATYNVYNRFYTGLKYQFSKSVTAFDVANKPDQVANLSGFGIPVSFDNRNYVYNATNGWSINLLFSSNVKWLGSDIEFSSLSLNANNYRKLNAKAVLASRLFVYGGLGDVPFVGQKVIGGKDLRGYTKGEYRSNSVTAIQSEYRLNFYKKWGAVGFGGLAYAFESNGIAASGLLPAIGAGLRYAVIPKRKMNAGVDLAFGRNDWGVYFRVGEAF